MNTAVGTDYSRVQKKPKRGQQSDHDAILSGVDTPNYSQDVRKPCQQRLVQWIPIRPQSLSIVIASCWLMWGLLLASHYFLHTSANSIGRSTIPALQLLDLRSPHSIANWMNCQLWLLTALASWMVYSIRKHRLDDFSATYRVWVVMIGLSIFSCFDTSTQATYLIGQSIDPWTRREIGYGGWPLILAAYASVVALVGLRLSGELRISRAAIVLWFSGLLAWGCAALLGTGLLKIQWSPGLIDLIVGGCWLGGVLAIFQAVGLVLRRCYLQAQRRFLERTALSKPKRSWEQIDDSSDTEDESQETADLANEALPKQKKSWLPWRRSSSSLEKPEIEDDSNPQADEELLSSKQDSKPKKPMRLFGLFPHRNERNEQLVGAEPIRVEEQAPVDQGLTKKQGWFTKSDSSKKQSTTTPPQGTVVQQTSEPRASVPKPNEGNTTNPMTDQKSKRSWLSSVMRKKPQQAAPSETSSKATNPSSTGSTKPAAKETTSKDLETVEPKVKKNWFAFGSKKSNSDAQADLPLPDSKLSSSRTAQPTKSREPEMVDAFEILDEEKPKSKKIGKKLLGWLDGFKLKPPKDTAAIESPSKSTSPSSNSTTSSNPNTATSANANPGSATNSSKPQQPRGDYEEDETEDDYGDYRNLSKAERKRLRRQQNDRGAA